MATKVCSKCGEEKDVETGFYSQRRKCKKCLSEHRIAYEHERKKTDKYKERMKVYRKSNKYKEAQSRYRKTDKYKAFIAKQKETDKYNARRMAYYKSDKCRFRKKIKDSRVRGIEFLLSMDQFVDFIHASECSYCKNSLYNITATLSFIREYDGECEAVVGWKRKISTALLKNKDMTIDRLNSGKGYVDGNCVPACVFCNLSKGFLIPSDQYKLIAPAVIANIVRICKEAGMSIPLASTELSSEDECG